MKKILRIFFGIFLLIGFVIYIVSAIAISSAGEENATQNAVILTILSLVCLVSSFFLVRPFIFPKSKQNTEKYKKITDAESELEELQNNIQYSKMELTSLQKKIEELRNNIGLLTKNNCESPTDNFYAVPKIPQEALNNHENDETIENDEVSEEILNSQETETQKQYRQESNIKPTYIEIGNTIYRADRKPISDEEIPYLMEIGYRKTLKKEQSKPKLSARDEELAFQFMMNHGLESQKRCDKFLNLNRLAFDETNIDNKIMLLQQAIEAFEAAKEWHYKYSKGGKLHFQTFYEQLHNSTNSCFCWVDSVKDELEFQIYKRDFIIPWIIENAQTGFLQTRIYKQFPEHNKYILRNVIDELAQNSVITKIKKGNSYFITV